MIMNNTKKIHINSSEIKHPNGFHSDQLGFTFRWNGHFLRGIHPESADIAMRYFECGFIDEICRKGMFPKTWISEYENEEFAFIIEHEMMTPLLYATDWNFSMLRDAAALVLDIAKIAKKYGYNMIDCHKLNVMFKYGKPMYVDLGSFILCGEGTAAWRPYMSYLRSYFYILDIWHKGAGQIAKRSMTPGVEFPSNDYHLWKYIIWRWFPKSMNRCFVFKESIHALASTDYQNIVAKTKGRSKWIQKASLLVKKAVNFFKPIKSQRQVSLDLMARKISRMSIGRVPLVNNSAVNQALVEAINCYAKGTTATVFEPNSSTMLEAVLSKTPVESIIAVHENDVLSDTVYEYVKKNNLAVTCTYYQISEGGLLIRGRYPEDRLKSDIVVVANYHVQNGLRGVKSTEWFISERMKYSQSGTLFFVAPSEREDLFRALDEQYDVRRIAIQNESYCCLVINNRQIL